MTTLSYWTDTSVATKPQYLASDGTITVLTSKIPLTALRFGLPLTTAANDGETGYVAPNKVQSTYTPQALWNSGLGLMLWNLADTGGSGAVSAAQRWTDAQAFANDLIQKRVIYTTVSRACVPVYDC